MIAFILENFTNYEIIELAIYGRPTVCGPDDGHISVLRVEGSRLPESWMNRG